VLYDTPKKKAACFRHTKADRQVLPLGSTLKGRPRRLYHSETSISSGMSYQQPLRLLRTYSLA
jgi:hypothetical protein